MEMPVSDNPYGVSVFARLDLGTVSGQSQPRTTEKSLSVGQWEGGLGVI